jgi:molybdopterin molybdotransferase
VIRLKEGVGFYEALELILERIPRMPTEIIGLADLPGRVLAADVEALVDSPNRDVSLKDGYAVRSSDLTAATENHPALLRLAGSKGAGDPAGSPLLPGTAVRVTTGASVPADADAVLAEEFAREESGRVICTRDAGPGRNILFKGTDVGSGRTIALAGERLTPGLVGLLAAAGLNSAKVFGRPRTAVLGTGDEVIAPGLPLKPGQLYASNMVETAAWIGYLGFPQPEVRVAPDDRDEILSALRDIFARCDAMITSGGAWSSERDLMFRLLNHLGWEPIFQRVRLGPGKAAGFGLLEGKPVFILPGGPPSHEAAFLLLALPGLAAMTGRREPVFPTVRAVLTEPVEGRAEWTQVVHAELTSCNGGWSVKPIKWKSRLSSMARKNSYIVLPEGIGRKERGEAVEAILLEYLRCPEE